MKKFAIEFTIKDFYEMVANKLYDDIDWEAMNAAEKAQFRKTLEDGIEEILKKSSFTNFLKRYLLEFYEETDLDEFGTIMNKAVKDANKRIDAEAKQAAKEEKIQTKAVEVLREKALLAKLKRKYGN